MYLFYMLLIRRYRLEHTYNYMSLLCLNILTHMLPLNSLNNKIQRLAYMGDLCYRKHIHLLSLLLFSLHMRLIGHLCCNYNNIDILLNRLLPKFQLVQSLHLVNTKQNN